MEITISVLKNPGMYSYNTPQQQNPWYVIYLNRYIIFII